MKKIPNTYAVQIYSPVCLDLICLCIPFAFKGLVSPLNFYQGGSRQIDFIL